jgi:hypothetical protein
MKTKVEPRGHEVQALSLTENQCVWMKAGVVNGKTCENAFDCTSCAFDKGINGKANQRPTALVSWRKVMRSQPKKECRHMLTGRVIFKLCSHDFQCQDCAYDQLLDDYDLLLGGEDLAAQVSQAHEAAGFLVADGYC